MYNVIIIGAGPSGLFSALELESLGVRNILLLDKSPFSSGGFINDGKLNFDRRIGFDFEVEEEILQKVKRMFLEHPSCVCVTDPTHPTIKDWEEVAQMHGATLISPEQYHYGSNNGKSVVSYLTSKLRHTKRITKEVESIEVKDGYFQVDEFTSKVVLVAPGRSGAKWFKDISKNLQIVSYSGPLDVGIRVECDREILDTLTGVIYDPKFIVQTKRHKDKVRTFCTNPGGRVRIEKYNGFNLVNGDALSDRKTNNTNFALLNTIPLTEPFTDATELGRLIALQFHLLGGGKPIVQRVGNFREGKRSRFETFDSSAMHFDCCKASLHCTPGDISLAMPARIMDNLWETLKVLDKIITGLLHPSTLIYGPELKIVSAKYNIDNFETSQKGLFIAGDGCGVSRGIVGAAASGIAAARSIKERYF